MITRESLTVNVISNTDLGGNRFRLRTTCGPLQYACRPGQFFNMTLCEGSPYLPRPFSIYEKFAEEQSMDFLIAKVGQGTEALSRLKQGDSVNLIGPLGQGFPERRASHHVYVAGSIGLAPFLELFRTLSKSQPDSEHTLIYGCRNKAELVDVPFLENEKWNVKTCTDDGSFGFKGRVTDLINLDTYSPDTQFYTCGPDPMMKAVADKVLSNGFNLDVSLEEHMACGVGICKGCVIYSKEAKPPLTTICRKGPVFDARAIYQKSHAT